MMVVAIVNMLLLLLGFVTGLRKKDDPAACPQENAAATQQIAQTQKG